MIKELLATFNNLLHNIQLFSIPKSYMVNLKNVKRFCKNN
ncbi:hypothetical protein [Viridibacillus arvi]